MCAPLKPSPEQIHIALGTSPDSMTVTFATLGSASASTTTSQVQYRAGASEKETSVPASISTYSAGGWVGLIHRATLASLQKVAYQYRCGVATDGGAVVWSDWLSFDWFANAVAADRPFSFAMVADLDGREEAGLSTMAALGSAAQAGALDAVLHAGDIAYIKGAENEATYDEYFRQAQAFAAHVPYHVAVGNQEKWNDFAGYDARFSMPGPRGNASNMWHSVDLGPVHALFLSTEHDVAPGSPQYAFAEADLAAANAAATPWVLVLLHRPLYCSTNDYYDCEQAGPYKLRPDLEPLLVKHKVTAVVAGHVHNYERTAPVVNGSVVEPAAGPVHVTVGNAGDIEGMTHGWAKTRPAWSVARSLALGWSRWTATATTLRLDLLATANGTVLDTHTFSQPASGKLVEA